MEKLKVSNVVVCLNLKKITDDPHFLLQSALEKSNAGITRYHNFSVIRDGQLKYIIFEKSGHVNLIGTKNFESIPSSLSHFSKFIGQVIDDCKIVNSTWTTKVIDERDHTCLIDLPRVQRECPGGRQYYRCSLRSSVFPAGILRHHTLPTVILFKNGTLNILGAKNESEARAALSDVLSKIHFIKNEEDKFGINLVNTLFKAAGRRAHLS